METRVAIIEAGSAGLRLGHLSRDGFNIADGERLIQIDIAELTGREVTKRDHITTSHAAQTNIAKNYGGLPA